MLSQRTACTGDAQKLDICSYPGYRRTNILLDIKSGGGGPEHASVIVHPEAPPEWRYEMFIIRLPGWEHPYKVVQGFALPTDSSQRLVLEEKANSSPAISVIVRRTGRNGFPGKW